MTDYLNTIRAACGIQCTAFRTNAEHLIFRIEYTAKNHYL